MEEDLRTVWCGNLSEKITEEILYELFLQAGPVDSVSLPKNNDGRPRPFAFIKYEHECSAPYAVALFHNTSLYGRTLKLKSRNREIKMPKILKNLINANTQGNTGPTSWKELKDTETSDNYRTETNTQSIPPPQITDFDTLLQMGQQMMLPGICGFPPLNEFPFIPGNSPGMFPSPSFPAFPSVTNNCLQDKDDMRYPGRKHNDSYGGDHKSYEHSVKHNHDCSERDNRRYRDREYKNRNHTRPYDLADHRSRDRKYSSSHSLGHRERR